MVKTSSHTPQTVQQLLQQAMRNIDASDVFGSYNKVAPLSDDPAYADYLIRVPFDQMDALREALEQSTSLSTPELAVQLSQPAHLMVGPHYGHPIMSVHNGDAHQPLAEIILKQDGVSLMEHLYGHEHAMMMVDRHPQRLDDVETTRRKDAVIETLLDDNNHAIEDYLQQVAFLGSTMPAYANYDFNPQNIRINPETGALYLIDAVTMDEINNPFFSLFEDMHVVYDRLHDKKHIQPPSNDAETELQAIGMMRKHIQEGAKVFPFICHTNSENPHGLTPQQEEQNAQLMAKVDRVVDQLTHALPDSVLTAHPHWQGFHPPIAEEQGSISTQALHHIVGIDTTPMEDTRMKLQTVQGVALQDPPHTLLLALNQLKNIAVGTQR